MNSFYSLVLSCENTWIKRNKRIKAVYYHNVFLGARPIFEKNCVNDCTLEGEVAVDGDGGSKERGGRPERPDTLRGLEQKTLSQLLDMDDTW